MLNFFSFIFKHLSIQLILLLFVLITQFSNRTNIFKTNKKNGVTYNIIIPTTKLRF